MLCNTDSRENCNSEIIKYLRKSLYTYLTWNDLVSCGRVNNLQRMQHSMQKNKNKKKRALITVPMGVSQYRKLVIYVLKIDSNRF
jgi:hypothetical protein